MSYTVNPTTLLFNDLNEEEAIFLENQIEKLVLRGVTTDVWDSVPFKTWCEAAGYDHRQALLVMATAYPQRALLSLLYYVQVTPRSKLAF